MIAILLATLFVALATLTNAAHLNATFNITTRDGIHLKTYLFVPDETIFKPPYSTIYEKSPYNFDDLLRPDSEYFTSLGFVYIGQQCRGREGSGGNYSFWRTSGNDTIDTIHWWSTDDQVKTWSNGQLAVAGISADCIAQYADATGVTRSGYWPNGNYTYYSDLFYKIQTGVLALGSALAHQTVYQGGAYRQGLISGWLTDNHETFMIDVLWQNEAWNPWWFQLQGEYQNQWGIENRTIINFAGWYDIFSTVDIETVLAINSTAMPGAQGNQLLFIDPGGHCPMGAILWKEDFYGWEVMLADIAPKILHEMFNKNKNGEKPFNIHDYVSWNVMFYMLGPNKDGDDNVKGLFWVQSKYLPYIEEYVTYYMTDNKELTLTKPINNNQDSSLTYEYDPSNPVRTWGGNNLIIQPCGPQDQAFVERDRSDVLQFDSANLTDYLALVGRIKVNLFVSSDAPDTDFTAKLIDIFPDGREMLVQDSILRMRWRNGTYSTSPELMQNGEIYNVTVDLGYMSYIFNPKHRIRVSVSSSNYPRFAVNYNSGLNMVNGSTDARTAKNTLHFGSSKYPSNVVLPKVSLDWLEQHKVDATIPIRNEQLERAGINITDFVRDLKKRIFDKKLL